VLVHRHRGTLDVPTRPADAERCPPRRLVGERRLPQHEVERMPAVRIVRIPSSGTRETHHLLFRVVRQLPELGKRRDVEIDRAGGQVRVSGVEQLRDEVDDARHRFRRPRLGHRWTHLECSHVGVEARHLRLGQLEVRHAELACLWQDRVIDIGDVAHHAHVVPELFEAPNQDVVGQVRRRVPEVGRVVRCDPAHVHPYRLGWLEGDDCSACGVVETHRSATPTSVGGSPASCDVR
jgi:hypothetical protein